MDTRHIGSLTVSTVGLGCNNFGWHIDEKQARAVVDAALDVGVTLFDTADIYGEGQSEAMLGRALGDRRDGVLIASKFGYDREDGQRGAASTVREACEASLRRLGTDYIDLYYLHKPDPETPITETLTAMLALQKEGKVREIACSNFTAQQLREAAKAGLELGAHVAPGVETGVAGSARFAAVQNEYSLLHRAPEEGVLQACEEVGTAFVPYFPLKSGLLTGKYRKDDVPQGSRLVGHEGSHFDGMGNRLLTKENLETVEALIDFAEARGHTILDLAFSWLLSHDAVASVIAGATKPEQIRANVEAAGWKLTTDDLAEIDRLAPQVA